MKLILAEKPSVARDICAALGGFRQTARDVWESSSYVCTSARGHLLELCEPHDFDPKFKTWSFRCLPVIPGRFRIKPKPDLVPMLEKIKALVERDDVTAIINACDAAREGELIFREIMAYCRTSKSIERVWLQSLTPESIRDGFRNLRSGTMFDGLAAAASCRAKTDWLIGLNTTRALTLHMRNYPPERLSPDSASNRDVFPAGRVQTPTLALIVRRWREIQGFKPQAFHRIEVVLGNSTNPVRAHVYDPNFKKNDQHPERRDDRFFDSKSIDEILSQVQGAIDSGLAATITPKVSMRFQQSPALFHLTALQQTMAQRYNWTAKRTLEAAQRCYEEHKVLTYPRTDSPCLPSDYETKVPGILAALKNIPEFRDPVVKIEKEGLKNKKLRFDDSKVSDHFAIVPTGKIKSGVTHDSTKTDDSLLFGVVAKRFLAAFQADARHIKVERKGLLAGVHLRGVMKEYLLEPGWLATYGKNADPEAPALVSMVGSQVPGSKTAAKKSTVSGPTAEKLLPLSCKAEAGATRPPPAVDEAALLRLMQFAGKNVDDPELAAALTAADGLGTPATRAEIIENLKFRRYVLPDLTPTPKGVALIDRLETIRANRLTSAELTADLELQLSRVQRGELDQNAFMAGIESYTREIVTTLASGPGMNPQSSVKA